MNVAQGNVRATAVVRRLRKGDRFINRGELVEVTGLPEKVDGNGDFVNLPVIKVDGGQRARRRKINAHLRVRIVH